MDGTVRRIGFGFDPLGRLATATSYNDPTAGDVVNQVQRVYNAFGLLSTEYQEHGGAVNTSTSHKVGYSYSDGSANHVRPTSVTYPNGRVLRYEYSTGTDATLNRVSFLADDDQGQIGTHLAEYTYLGAGSIVHVAYPQPGIRSDLAHGSGSDPYAGLDRFGRVVDLRWTDSSGQATLDRIQHGYDRASNRLWRINTALPTGVDELYSYDGVNQLVDMQRGVLNTARTALTTKAFQQQWTLDATGNWSAFKEDRDGDNTWDVSQTRTHNAANELLSTTDPTLSLTHDRAGNMAVVPNPQSLIPNPSSLTYDAWNRLVRVSDGEVTIAEYEYDALFRRIRKWTPCGSSMPDLRGYYYTAQWQMVEQNLSPHYQESFVEERFVWGVRYIDDLVLRERDADADGVLDERLFAMQDANWNVITIAAPDGAIAERYRYDAYGRPIYLYPDGTVNPNGSDYAWPVLFTGRHLDPDTGLYHYRYRDYHHSLGRWLSRDSIAADINLYRYCGNNSVLFVDPSGLVDVYVWPAADGRWGHASMKLNNGTYISWWPQSDNRNYGFLGWGNVVNSYSVPAIPNRPFSADVKDEGNTQPQTTKIDGLDENAIQKWWDKFRNDPKNKWSTATGNCSTTVATGLKAGGADVDYADTKKAHCAIWKPSDVQKYADAVKKHMKDKQTETCPEKK